MQTIIVKHIVNYLREIADKLEAGTCDLTEDEAMDLLSTISHKRLSKEQACMLLNISHSKFDLLVRQGDLPKGRKVIGFKELVWYEDELNKCISKINN